MPGQRWGNDLVTYGGSGSQIQFGNVRLNGSNLHYEIKNVSGYTYTLYVNASMKLKT
jgi:hypothetical protein